MRKDTDAAYSNFLRSGFLDSEIKKNENKGRTYHRIVKANKKAKKMGLSYGRYMAGYERKKQMEYLRKHHLAENDMDERMREAEKKQKKDALAMAEDAIRNKVYGW